MFPELSRFIERKRKRGRREIKRRRTKWNGAD